jgi:hypothetical protein
MTPISTLALLTGLASAAEPQAVLTPKPPLSKRSDRSEKSTAGASAKPGLSIGPRIGGGGISGGTLSWDLGTGTLFDLGLSLRPAVRDLEWSATLMASAGVAWELWGNRAQQGVFLAGGSSIPGLPYYESYTAGGYHWRLNTRAGRFGLQMRFGGGVMPYGELNSSPQGVRPMLYLSVDPLWLVKEAE